MKEAFIIYFLNQYFIGLPLEHGKNDFLLIPHISNLFYSFQQRA